MVTGVLWNVRIENSPALLTLPKVPMSHIVFGDNFPSAGGARLRLQASSENGRFARSTGKRGNCVLL